MMLTLLGMRLCIKPQGQPLFDGLLHAEDQYTQLYKGKRR